MRKLLWLMLAILIFLPACGNEPVAGSGNIANDTRPVPGIRTVSFKGGGTLMITQGQHEQITVEADDNILPHITAEVEAGVLTLEPGASINPSREIIYRLSVRELQAIRLEGAGHIRVGRLASTAVELHLDGSGEIDVDTIAADTVALQLVGSGRLVVTEITADRLAVQLHGSGEVTAAGRVEKQAVTIDGSGNYRGEALESRSAAVSLARSGNVTLSVREQLDLAVDGNGRIAYYGQPVIGEQIVGEAELVPLDDRESTFSWQAYASVAEAGYSEEALSEARSYFDDLGAGAVLIVVDGKILTNWGDTNRRFFNASVRKGFLNALVGIAVERGQLDLDTTIGELGIDDVQSLTAQERKATLRDLIMARSGVYHPGVFEDQVWVERRPERGSSAPGEHWFYNNWDFNVLGYVYEQATGTSIFQAFAEEIASPLGMQDYRLLDGAYYEDPGVSRYPAYLFKTSARDMARFGLLYLNDGVWTGERVLPSEWITRSLRPASAAFNDGTGFGYLWWHTSVNGHDVYYAHGAGTQGIYLVPAYDLVYVFRDDTYDFESITDTEALELLSLILEAKKGKAVSDPALVATVWPDRLLEAKPVDPDVLREHFGVYVDDRIGNVALTEEGGQVLVDVKRGRFRVLSVAGRLLLEDIELRLVFVEETEEARQADLVVDEEFRLYSEFESPHG